MANKSRFSAEQKLEAVRRHICGNESTHEIARDYGVDHQTIRNWVIKYEISGGSWLVDTKGKEDYSEETKRCAVQDYINGVGSQVDICKKYKIRSARALQLWLEEYNGTKDRIPQTEPKPKIKKVKTPEIKWEGLPLKMVVTKSLKLEAIAFCAEHDFNYAFTAEKFGVSYTQVYSWVKKYEKDGEAGLEDRRGRRKAPEEISEIDRLKAENRMLRAENRRKDIEIEVLKKAQGLERG